MRGSNVDDRIVQMRLDNSNFERNAKQSLSTLEKLDRSINDLGENYSNETFSKMADALELISDRFTTLGIVGVRVLENITDAAFATGQRLLKAFTVDNVSDGFAKYESLIESVQKIMNATGLSIDTVSEKVNEFRWFSDETSYSLEDMVRYLGQFTSSGVAVDDAKASILGLATASGLYGVSAEMATHAMQGFSKAIANGKMSTNEWRWIQTAALNTTGFKQELINAAVAEGLLTEAGEGVWRTTKGTTVSVAQFEQTLHDGWLTTKAMSRALSKYGSTAEEIYRIHGETGKSAWEILQEEGLIEEGLGRQAFEASQIAKTWKDVLKSVKDAVSSGWAKTFELLIGDFEEATEFWGVVAEELYNLFAEGGNIRNEILQIWHDAGGRDDLLAAAKIIWEEFVNLLDLIKQAWRDIFGTFGPTEDQIAEVCELLGIDAVEALELVGDETSRAALGIWMFTKRIRKFFESIRPSEKTLDKLSRIFKGIFSFLDILRIGLGAVWDILSAFFPTLRGLGSGFLEIVANIADYISGVRDSLRESDSFASSVENIVAWIQTAIKNVREFFDSFSLEHLWEQLRSWFSKISEFFGKFFTNPFSTSSGSFVETIEELFGFGGTGLLAYGFYRLLNFGKNVVGGITGILDSIGEAIGSFEKQAKTSNMLRIAASIGILAVSLMLLASIDADRLHQASLALTGLFAALVSAATIYSNADSILNTLFGAKGFLFGDTAKGLKGLLGSGSKFTSLIKLAAAVLILALSLKAIASIDTEKLVPSFIALVGIIALIVGASMLLSSDKVGFKGKGLGKLIFVALAIAILAGVAKSLSKLTIPELLKGIGGLIAVVLAIGALTLMLGGDNKSFKGKRLGQLIFVSLAIAILAGVAKSLSKLSVQELAKGIGGLIAVVLAIGALTLMLGGDNKSFKGKRLGQLIFVSLAIAILAGVAKSLSKLTIPELLKGIGSLVGVAAVLLGFSYLMSKLNEKNNTVSIKNLVQYIVIAATISIVAKSLSRLARYDWKHLIGAAASISVCLLAISGAIRLISKDRGIAFDKSNYGMIILSLASIMAIGYALIQLSGQKWSSLLAAAASISGCLLAIAGAIRIVKKLKVDSAVAILIGYAACAGAMIGIAYALNQLEDYDAVDLLKKAGIMAGSILAMAIIIALLGKIGPNILSSVSVLIGLASCVGAMIGIAYALNQLKDYDANDLFKKAAIMLGSILVIGLLIAALGFIGPGTIALGALGLAIIVGAVALIVWGLMELGPYIVDAAIDMAEKLGTFMDSLQPFINSITTFDSSLSDDFALFAAMMLELFKAEFWMALSELISRITGDTFAFGGKASRLLEDLQPFLAMVTGITAAHIAGVTMFRGFMKLLTGAEFWTTIAQWISNLTGDVLNLGQKMSNFMEDLQPFFGYLLALNPEINGKILIFNTVLRRMVSTSLWATIGEWVSGWSDSYSGFPAKMSSFISDLDPFLIALNKIDNTTLEKVGTFNQVISTLISDSIWGGVKAWISSWFEDDYNDFAIKISSFATNIEPFFDMISKYSGETFSNGMSFATMINSISDNSSLSYFGSQLDWFSSYAENLDYEKMNQSIAFLNDLAAAVTGVVALDFGSFTAFINWYDSVVSKLNGLPNITTLIFQETGKSAGQGFADGLRSKEVEVQNAATFIVGVALNAIRSALQIHSPSRVLENIGALGGEGLAEGFINAKNFVTEAASSMAKSAISPITSAIDNISAIVNSDMSISPLITPVMDMSSVYAANSEMDDLFSSQKSYSTQISQDIVSSSRPVATNTTNSNGTSANNSSGISGTSIYVNVYGAEGQNINDLANAVVEKISLRLDRRGVSFG